MSSAFFPGSIGCACGTRPLSTHGAVTLPLRVPGVAQRVQGLCRDLRACLFASPADPAEQRRRTPRISRSLALLRAHDLLRKVPHSHRYHLTPKGRTVITALLTARQADTAKLTAMAA
jgi:hypothetical protein